MSTSAPHHRAATDVPELIPQLLRGLVDDAAVFPPGSATLPEALVAHRQYRDAWYAPLVGPLLIPASSLAEFTRTAETSGPAPEVGVVGDSGVEALPRVVEAMTPLATLRQVEVAVAKRGEDPRPGLRRLLALAGGWPGVEVYAEIPLTWGLLGALDTLAEARAAGARVAAKFRTGGLAAELFPTPVELAAVICACRDRDLPFKLTAGLHNAIRHTDPETGFVHHGFLNVLVGTALAAERAEVAEVAEALAGKDPVLLVEAGRSRREQPRPLWKGFGSCSIREPLTDMIRYGLVNGGYE